jgi:hypothetical protein
MAKIKVINSKEFRSEFKKSIESSNINLLLGAGFSYGIADTLGDTEKILEAIHLYGKDNEYAAIEAHMFWEFFLKTIYPLCDKVNDTNVVNQIEFIRLWKNILMDRESAVINKQANIFTTNYDIVLEYAFESIFLDYNDGFKGRITPYFSTTNFNRLYYERAIFTNRCMEIPIFNLLKLHGSVTWKIREGKHRQIVYNDYFKKIKEFHDKYVEFFSTEGKDVFNSIDEKFWLEDYSSGYGKYELDDVLPEGSDLIKDMCLEFINDFKSSFKIVNPTKQKFNDTLMDKNYYELMRIYCNELEKNNTILFAQGFSFDDEHIQEITMRALGNPSLTLIISAFNRKDVEKYYDKFEKFDNVWIVKNEDPTEEELEGGTEEKVLDISVLNRYLKDLFGDCHDE